MSKKLFTVMAVVVMAAMILSACAPAATAVAPKTKDCLVTDTGGINDKSFNASAWKGLTDAQTKLGADVKYLQSKQETDYTKNLQAYIDEKCDLIVTVGFLLGDATAAAGKANPNQKLAIVDYAYDPVIPNVLGLTFATDQAAFLAGYLAAGMTKTGKVASFGGLQIPTVTIFMDGFEAGVKYYNQKHNTSVVALGWDSKAQTGVFVGNFTSTDDGKNTATSLAQEGADIIMPVAGAVGLGSAAYCQTAGTCLIIGVDTDWFVSSNEYASVELSSVQKKIDVAVFKTVQDVVNGKFTGGTVTYALADGGVDLAPFHNFDSQVPQTLKDELTQVRADINSGTVTVANVLAAP